MKLALGTVQFGLNYGIANRQGRVSQDEARAILVRARERGVDTLDTAVAYGDSERRLGEIGVAGWQVISKLPAVPRDCADVRGWVQTTVEASLGRCKIHAFYGLLLHRPDQLLESGGDELFSALVRLKQDGLVRKIGVSIYEPPQLDVLCARYSFELVQAPFNILDRRLIDSGWMDRLQVQGTELHVRSIFLQGLLLLESDRRPEKFTRWASLWKSYEDWLVTDGLTPLQACVRYAHAFPGIAKVVVGVDGLAQFEAILQALGGPAPSVPAQLRSDDAALLNPARWADL